MYKGSFVELDKKDKNNRFLYSPISIENGVEKIKKQAMGKV